MKIKKSVVALMISVAAVAIFAAGVAAADTLATISAYLDYGATVELNGVKQDFLDANGNRIYLINYNGSMYLPVRKTAELVGLDVDWDGATHTVKLGNTKDADLIEDIGAYFLTSTSNNLKTFQYKSSDGVTPSVWGITVDHYLRFHMAGDNYYCAIGSKARAGFDLAGKYESVTFKCYCPQNAILRVYADDESLQKEITIRGGQVAQEFTVPLFGTRELTFEVEKTFGGGYGTENTNVYVFDATVKPIQK